ncbi:MAG TPA: discoidin domain-containing protein [Tepidisphaeraceae bacterium]|jgi:putative heme-binding domain-containing protein|nr:discoidin domain-containing protein [Tepidisphaeraceae bacterium]
MRFDRMVALATILFAFLNSSLARGEDDKPIRALLVVGGCCHDYTKQKEILTRGISARANVQWEIAFDPDRGTAHKNPVYENPDWAKDFDIVVHDECSADVKDLDFISRVLKPHKEGLPAVVLHCGMHCYRSEGFPNVITPWFEFTGLQTTGHGAQLPIAVTYVDGASPITKGMGNWTTINEELYNNIAGKVLDTAHPLARGKQGNDTTVVAWTNLYNNKAKVFATTLGHNNETVGDARYLDLVTRGLLWACGKLDESHLKPASQVLIHPPAAADPNAIVPLNLALGKSATSSSNQGDDRAASQAVDGDDSTRWCASDASLPQWWKVDLGTAQDVTSARITWEAAAQYGYKIEGSADDKSWTLLADETKSDSAGQVRQHKFDAKSVRYLKVTVSTTGAGQWASMFEFEAFGSKMVKASEQRGSSAVAPGREEDRKLLAGVKPAKGFHVGVFAAPPEVGYPTCLTTSPTGEVYVGVDENGSLDTKPGRGRVVRCIDSTGSGHADKFNVFATMDSPRGLLYDHHVLYVLHPPCLTAYYDDNGTGTANRSEDLVTGLAHDLKWRGADHTTNGIQIGIDGWIYIACGDYGAPKAVGKDGTTLQLHGGGVLRVRPDGSGLEVVSHGQRNIYDVAIDPLMNIFTCDNTNDGDGWDERLSQVFSTANFGYPSLFMHFPDEIVQPLVDYGGGAPTGVAFIDEPGLPAEFGHALYTCEWGQSIVYRHPLSPSGATYAKPPRISFVDIPRPTDMDVDGQSRIYISSWRGGGFNYGGPKIGFVAQVTHPDAANLPPFPDLQKQTDAQLVQLIASPSHFCRLHTQREILRRGDKPVFDEGLEKLAMSADATLAQRVAAIFTLRQLHSAASTDALLKLVKDNAVREFALRALADDQKLAKELATDSFVAGLTDANPRVRLQAVIALGRIGKAETAQAMVPLLADGDSVVSHATVQNLIKLHAAEACFKALDSGSPSMVPAAARVLQAFHEAAVVDGLSARLANTKDPVVRQAVFRALCRLYGREADWDGNTWWGTRPDTTGPYFKAVTWEQSEKVLQALQGALAGTDGDKPAMLLELRRHRVELPQANAMMLALAEKDPAFRAKAVDLLLGGNTQVPEEAVGLLEGVAENDKDDPTFRAKALAALDRLSGKPAGFEAAVRAFAASGKGDAPAGDLVAARNAFIKDGKNARLIAQWATYTASQDPAIRELAYSVLLYVSGPAKAPTDAKAAADKAVEAAWAKPAAAASLLRAAGQTRSMQVALQIRAHLNDANAEVKQAAVYAAGQLQLNKPAAGGMPLVSTMKYEDVVAAAVKEKGDVNLGAQLFQRQGCINCHTVAANQPPKGPFLGGIATRYSRPELLESILKPSAKIAQGFETHWFSLKTGERPMGFIVRESGDSVELRDVTGVSTLLPIKDVVKRGTLPTSVMPEGLADNLTVQDLASILAYLESLKGNAK